MDDKMAKRIDSAKTVPLSLCCLLCTVIRVTFESHFLLNHHI